MKLVNLKVCRTPYLLPVLCVALNFVHIALRRSWYIILVKSLLLLVSLELLLFYKNDDCSYLLVWCENGTGETYDGHSKILFCFFLYCFSFIPSRDSSIIVCELAVSSYVLPHTWMGTAGMYFCMVPLPLHCPHIQCTWDSLIWLHRIFSHSKNLNLCSAMHYSIIFQAMNCVGCGREK